MFTLLLLVSVAFAQVDYTKKKYLKTTKDGNDIYFATGVCLTYGTKIKNMKFYGVDQNKFKIEIYTTENCGGEAQTLELTLTGNTMGMNFEYADAITDYVYYQEQFTGKECGATTGVTVAFKDTCTTDSKGVPTKYLVVDGYPTYEEFTDAQCKTSKGKPTINKETQQKCGECAAKSDTESMKATCHPKTVSDPAYTSKKYLKTTKDGNDIYFATGVCLTYDQNIKNMKFTGFNKDYFKIEKYESDNCGGTAIQLTLTLKGNTMGMNLEYADEIKDYVYYQEQFTGTTCGTATGVTVAFKDGCYKNEEKYVKFVVINNVPTAQEYTDAQCKTTKGTPEADPAKNQKCGECAKKSDTESMKATCKSTGGNKDGDKKPDNGTTVSFVLMAVALLFFLF